METKSKPRISKIFRSLSLCSNVFAYFSNVSGWQYALKNIWTDSKTLYDKNAKCWTKVILKNSKLRVNCLIRPSDFKLREYIMIASNYSVNLMLESTIDLRIIIDAYKECKETVNSIQSFICREKDLHLDILLNILLSNFLARLGIYRKGDIMDLSKLSNFIETYYLTNANWAKEIDEFSSNLHHHIIEWKKFNRDLKEFHNIDSQTRYLNMNFKCSFQNFELLLEKQLKNVTKLSIGSMQLIPEYSKLLDFTIKNNLQYLEVSKSSSQPYQLEATFHNGWLYYLENPRGVLKWYTFKNLKCNLEFDKEVGNNYYKSDNEFRYFNLKLVGEGLIILKSAYHISITDLKESAILSSEIAKKIISIICSFHKLSIQTSLAYMLLISYTEPFELRYISKDKMSILYKLEKQSGTPIIEILPHPWNVDDPEFKLKTKDNKKI